MKYRVIIKFPKGKNIEYYTEVKRWWGWTPLFYNGDEITWISRWKIHPHVYTYSPHWDLEGAKGIIERHKEKYIWKRK